MSRSLSSIASRRLTERTSRQGFTLIELLVFIAVITVIHGIFTSAKVNKTELKSETYEAESQSTWFSLETEVELDCALSNGWVSVIDPENPGTFVLKNSSEGERSYAIELASNLSKADPNASGSTEAPTLNSLEDPVNTGGSTFRTQAGVTYRFDAISQKCLASLSFRIPRDEVFEKVSETEWQSRESELRLNIISQKVFSPGELVPLLPEIYQQIYAANPTGLSFTSQPVRYEVRADMSGVLVGTGASGDEKTEIKTAQAPMQLGANGAMGCGLMKASSTTQSSMGFIWLTLMASLLILGTIGLRQKLRS